MCCCTVEPPFNKPLKSEVLGTMNDIRSLNDSTLEYMEMNPETTKPRYGERILPVYWPFVISRFHCVL